MRRQPLCVHCLAANPPRVRLFEELDHIIPLETGGTDTEDNIQGLCKECHAIKTEADRGLKRKLTFGPDGFPIEG